MMMMMMMMMMNPQIPEEHDGGGQTDQDSQGEGVAVTLLELGVDLRDDVGDGGGDDALLQIACQRR